IALPDGGQVLVPFDRGPDVGEGHSDDQSDDHPVPAFEILNVHARAPLARNTGPERGRLYRQAGAKLPRPGKNVAGGVLADRKSAGQRFSATPRARDSASRKSWSAPG